MPDLWPKDIATAKLPEPLAILKEQAAALGQKTENVVEGDVVLIEDAWTPARPDLVYAFFIVGPRLGGYRYRLLTIRCPDPVDYPVQILVEPEIFRHVPERLRVKVVLDAPPMIQEDLSERMGANVRVNSEDDFKEALKAIFNAPKTRRVVEAIIAQSTG